MRAGAGDRGARRFNRSCWPSRTSSFNATAANNILARFKKLFPGTKISAPGRSGGGDGRANPRLRIFLRQNQSHPRHRGKNFVRRRCPSSRQIVKLTDDEIIARLTEVRGVGRWTVEMLLIFQLGPPRCFAGGRFWRAHRLSPSPTKSAKCQSRKNCSRSAKIGGRTAPPPRGISGARPMRRQSNPTKRSDAHASIRVNNITLGG